MAVLYRKYRPKTFEEIIGQENIIRTLKNALIKKNIAHAYLFSGPRGSGKTTVARIFAKAVNCHNPQGGYEPCNQCEACLAINEGRALDIIEIDAASQRGIDEFRELKEGFKTAPSFLKYKVYIIDEAHQLTKEAVNAFLKTLEEPPSYIIFILATTEAYKMMPTIISRCQRFNFHRFDLNQIKKRIGIIAAKEKISIEEEAKELIALSSGGSLRDAESILDQVITFCGADKKITKKEVEELLGLSDRNMVIDFSELLIKGDLKNALLFIERIYREGYDLAHFLNNLLAYFRQALISKINPESKTSFLTNLTPQEIERLKKQIEKINQKDIERILQILLEAENKMRYSSMPQLPLELALVDILAKK